MEWFLRLCYWKVGMKAAKVLTVITATVCCFLILHLASQIFSGLNSSENTKVQAQHFFSTKTIGESAAISGPLFEINFSFSSQRDFETDHHCLWAIRQWPEYLFDIDSGYSGNSFNYFIHHHKASLIFPFHHFL